MSDPQDRQSHRLSEFEAIVSEYEAALLRYAHRLLGSIDAAQDVVQDVFIRLYHTWKDELKPGPQISTWLYRVTHNCSVDAMRREHRRELLHLRHATEKADDVEMPRLTFTPEISEAAEQASRALRTLNVREQQLVILKVYEDKSYKEISDITGLSTGNVGYILHHAMKKLAAAMRKRQLP